MADPVKMDVKVPVDPKECKDHVDSQEFWD